MRRGQLRSACDSDGRKRVHNFHWARATYREHDGLRFVHLRCANQPRGRRITAAPRGFMHAENLQSSSERKEQWRRRSKYAKVKVTELNGLENAAAENMTTMRRWSM